MNLSYRQWWMVDLCVVGIGVLAGAVTGESALYGVAAAFLILDRIISRVQTGDWLSQPAAESNGGDSA